MEPKLTPQQALDLLAQASAQFRGTRQEHELLARALSVLSAAISEAPAPKE